MSIHSSNLGRHDGARGQASAFRRSLVLVAVTVAVGLGTGFATGSLVKGAAHRPQTQLSKDLTRTESIPIVPLLRTVATLPVLRSRPKRHTASPASTPEGSVKVLSPSVASPASTASAPPAAAAPSAPRASSAPKPAAPSHSEGGVVHHESGGGA